MSQSIVTINASITEDTSVSPQRVPMAVLIIQVIIAWLQSVEQYYQWEDTVLIFIKTLCPARATEDLDISKV